MTPLYTINKHQNALQAVCLETQGILHSNPDLKSNFPI